MPRVEIYDPSFIDNPDDAVNERLTSPLCALLADLMIECELAATRFQQR